MTHTELHLSLLLLGFNIVKESYDRKGDTFYYHNIWGIEVNSCMHMRHNEGVKFDYYIKVPTNVNKLKVWKDSGNAGETLNKLNKLITEASNDP